MHLLLTDRLACPRCGPAFGLVLLADAMDGRRVAEGSLGCANCRERYPIREGRADLRPPPRGPLAAPPDLGDAPDPTLALPVAAAMGVADAPGGRVLLLGRAAALAPALAALLPPGVEVVAAAPWAEPDGTLGPPISRVIVSDGLPFFDGTFAGVALHGAEAERGALREARRVLARGHRVALVAPPDDAQVRLGGAGLTRFVRGEGVAAAGW